MKRSARLAPPRHSRLKPMRVRSTDELQAIRDQHGSTTMAAFNGALNVDEYLLLESHGSHGEEHGKVGAHHVDDNRRP
jgi:hypothetical protein